MYLGLLAKNTMNAKDLQSRIDKTRAAIDRLSDRIEWLEMKVDYRRRRIRELGRLLSDELNFRLPLEDPGHHHDDSRVNRHNTTTST